MKIFTKSTMKSCCMVLAAMLLCLLGGGGVFAAEIEYLTPSAAATSATVSESYEVPTCFIVEYKDGKVTPSAKARVSAAGGDCDNSYRSDGEESWLVVDEETAKALADDSNVASIKESLTVFVSYTPNDPLYSDSQDLQYALRTLKAPAAWDLNYRGRSDLNVVVIDTGFDYDHEDKGIVKVGRDYFTGKDGTGDYEGHGTGTAGIIGAGFDNGIGMAGVLQYGNVYMLTCFKKDEDSPPDEPPSGDLKTISKAIREAVDKHHADVINMSFGRLVPSGYDIKKDDELLSLQSAIQYAHQKGVILVAAAGNNGDKRYLKDPSQVDVPNYPAAFPHVISVGSTNKYDQLSDYSNKNSSVDVVAPGEDIGVLSPGSKYASYASGTSFSAPYVAALAAMARTVDPKLSPDAFEMFLQKTSHDKGIAGRDNSYGYGLVDYEALLKAIQNKEFCDVLDTAWYAVAVNYLAGQKIVNGYNNSNNDYNDYRFKPTNQTTRAEFVKMLSSMRNLDDSDTTNMNHMSYDHNSKFSDVDRGAWYCDKVNWAYENGIVSGVSETRFSPNRPINRAEMAIMLANYVKHYGIELPQNSTAKFKDASSIPTWAESAVDQMTSAGILHGNPDGKFFYFHPGKPAPRCDVSQMLYNFLQIAG